MAFSKIPAFKLNPLLKQCLYLCAAIILVNLLIGMNLPTYVNLEDEVLLLDSVWRVVQGQQVGIDYHHPYGFGLARVGALVWHVIGPQDNVLELTAALFSLAIAFCGCIVAKRSLGHRSDFALLFCAMVAFVLSAPSIFGYPPTTFGMSEYYNRLTVAALAILFLQTFSLKQESNTRSEVDDAIVAACLLDILFLVKISGLVVGIGIVLAGCLVPGRIRQRLRAFGITALALLVMMAVEFAVTGLEVMPVFHEYEMAAQARLAYSAHDYLDAMRSVPTIGCIALLILYAISRRAAESRVTTWLFFLGIATFAASQLAIDLTNSQRQTMVPLAGAAAAVLAGWEGSSKPFAYQANGLRHWLRRLHPARLAEISVRDAIPLAIIGFVIGRQVVASIAGSITSVALALGVGLPPSEKPGIATAGSVMYALGVAPPPSEKTTVITAGRGMSLDAYNGQYAYSIKQGVRALAALEVRQQAIATLDFSNPFPLLFRARSPRGIRVYFDIGNDVPRGARLNWHDVIGDACFVMQPTPQKAEIQRYLSNAARAGLAAEFDRVYKDEWWTIYKRKANSGYCA